MEQDFSQDKPKLILTYPHKSKFNTLESINTVLRPTFELAVRDDIIRNPVDGAYAEVKKRNGGARKSRRALTVEQQREFIDYVAKNPFFFHWYPFFVFLLGNGVIS